MIHNGIRKMSMKKTEIIQRLIDAEIIIGQYQAETDVIKDVLMRLAQMEKHVKHLRAENDELKKMIRVLHPEVFS